MLGTRLPKEGELGQVSQTQPATAAPVALVTGSRQPDRCCGFVPFDPDEDTSITNPNIQRRHLAVMQRQRADSWMFSR